MSADRTAEGEPLGPAERLSGSKPSEPVERTAGGEPLGPAEQRSSSEPLALVERFVSVLRRARLTVATAESLTAGLISATIADVPGASAVLRGGLTAYNTVVKQGCLHIDPQLLEHHGAISSECAEAMAHQAQRLFGSDLAISATGVAGPEQQEGKPVGTVYVAVALTSEVQSARLSLSGDRRTVRFATVESALALALAAVERRGTSEVLRGRPSRSRVAWSMPVSTRTPERSDT